MAETDESPKGPSGERIFHSPWCSCSHKDCVPLKHDKWCCHWYFLYWVPARIMMPSEVVFHLRGIVPTKNVDYFVNPSSTGALRILVYVEDLTLPGCHPVNLIPRHDDFVAKDCQAWRFSCCEEEIDADWECWRSFLRESGGRPNFSKFSKFAKEGGTLVDQLNREVIDKVRSIVI